MKFNKQHFQITIGVVLGFLMAIFGVYIFSNFQYRGQNFSDDIISLITMHGLNNFWDGLYQLLGSGFLADWFFEFSASNIAASSVLAIFFGETIWPAILTWLSSGLIIGVTLKRFRKTLIWSSITFGILFVLWIITGLLAGADIAAIFTSNIVHTLGELFTAILFLLFGLLLLLGFVCLALLFLFLLLLLLKVFLPSGSLLFRMLL